MFNLNLNTFFKAGSTCSIAQGVIGTVQFPFNLDSSSYNERDISLIKMPSFVISLLLTKGDDDTSKMLGSLASILVSKGLELYLGYSWGMSDRVAMAFACATTASAFMLLEQQFPAPRAAPRPA